MPKAAGAVSEIAGGEPTKPQIDQAGKVLQSIADKTEAGLKELYPDKDVEVRLVSHKRDLAEQAKHYASGASQTPVSLHNFGLAGDYAIYIDGERVTADGSSGIHGSVEPYRVLGHFAREQDLFWGWTWDSGHVGETRFVTEALKKYPELADRPELKKLYSNLTSQGSIPKNLEGLVSTLGSIYNEDYSGSYSGDSGSLEDLLEPLNPYKPN